MVIKCLYNDIEDGERIVNLVVEQFLHGTHCGCREPVWFIRGYDLDKKEINMFSVKDMSNIKINPKRGI